MTLPAVDPATQSEAEEQETLVRSTPASVYCLVQVPPLFVDRKMLPTLSTVTQAEPVVHVIAARLFVPSMLCFVAVAAPAPDIARLSKLPTPSTAKQDVVEVQTTPLSAVVPSTLVVVQLACSLTCPSVVATWTVPTLSAMAQNEEDRQKTLFMLAVPCCSNVQAVEAGAVVQRKYPFASCPSMQKVAEVQEMASTP
jgi:hypothetical protein